MACPIETLADRTKDVEPEEAILIAHEDVLAPDTGHQRTLVVRVEPWPSLCGSLVHWKT